MRRILTLTLFVLLGGCGGVSKQQHQTQSVRLQQVEAKASELDGRLRSQQEATAALEAELAECREAGRGLGASVGESRQVVADLRGRLDECARREDAVRADLDLSRRSASAIKEELARSRAEFDRERQGWDARRAELTRALEGTRSENVTLQAEIHVLLGEKERVEREKREKLEEISQTYEGLLEGMREQVAQGKVTISNLRGQLSVKLQDEILFDSGSAVVKPEGRQLLAEIAGVLREIGDRGVLVEGHTDDVPIRGGLAERFATNWELSAARAISVVRYLQEVAGVEATRLAAAGYGEYRPAVTNDNPENRARNRRIELKLVPLETPQDAAGNEAEGTTEGENLTVDPVTATPGVTGQKAEGGAAETSPAGSGAAPAGEETPASKPGDTAAPKP